MLNINSTGRFVLAGVLTFLAVVGSASVVHADTRGWMAASSPESTLTGRSWGRLTLEDDELRFDSPNYKWRVALSQIKRVEASKASPRAFEIETTDGTIHFAAILDAVMMKDSPRKAIYAIQRGMREAREAALQR